MRREESRWVIKHGRLNYIRLIETVNLIPFHRKFFRFSILCLAVANSSTLHTYRRAALSILHSGRSRRDKNPSRLVCSVLVASLTVFHSTSPSKLSQLNGFKMRMARADLLKIPRRVLCCALFTLPVFFVCRSTISLSRRAVNKARDKKKYFTWTWGWAAH